MKFPNVTMGLLTLFNLMKEMKGPPVIKINASAGENIQLTTQYESAQEHILTSQWIFRKGNASIATNDVMYCKMEKSGKFSVNPLYSSKVERCDATSILLINLSINDVGYYILQFLRENTGLTESLPIFLSVSGPPVIKINASAGENIQLMTQYESAQEHILTSQWIFRKGNASIATNDVMYCKMEKSGKFSVNPLYSSKVERCDAMSILLINLSINDVGYYILQFLRENTGLTESLPIFLSVSAPDNHSSDMLGLLALLIIPVALVVICVLYRKKILSCARKPAVKEVIPDFQFVAQNDPRPTSPIVTETENVLNQMEEGGKLDIRKTDRDENYEDVQSASKINMKAAQKGDKAQTGSFSTRRPS